MSNKDKKDWAKYANDAKNKRKPSNNSANRKTEIGSHIVVEGEMIVQRLANIATGKAMKYEKLGPQEFVQYPYDELSIEKIKKACHTHFKSVLSPDKQQCDILVSQFGPSCSKLAHIKNFKLIYVRFISNDPPSLSVFSKIVNSSVSSRPQSHSDSTPSVSVVQTLKKAKSESQTSTSKVHYPESLSASSMLRLGSEISMKIRTPDSIDLIDFDPQKLEWAHPKNLQLFIDEEPFSQGGFRVVFRAKGSDGQNYVIKKFKKDIIEEIKKVNEHIEKKETVDSLAKKAVQMHKLAKSLADAFDKNLHEIGKKKEFGSAFKYNSIYLGRIKNNNGIEESVVVEEFIPGEFKKYINNDGTIVYGLPEDLEMSLKAQCLSHYTYVKSNKKLLLLDIQGAGFTLFDPEVATSDDALCDGKLKFCMGNLSTRAVEMFIAIHICNKYCQIIGLKHF